MAVKTTVNKRPFVNCKRTVMWKMTDEVNETYSSTPISFADRLTTYTDSVESNTTPLYGDGRHLEDDYSEGNGSLSLGLHHIADDERVEIYGEEANSDGAVISTGEEIPPYFCVALMAVKRNGMVNLRKFFKTKFSKHEESVTQQESGGVNYSMPTLSGSYCQNTRLGYKVVRIEVDPRTVEGAAFIENWYASPEFIGGSGLANNSNLKVSDTVVDSGSTITSGDTVTFNGAASGGTSPYTYSFYYRASGSNEWTAKAEDSSTATATQTITVTTQTAYEFKLVVKDANGVSIAKYNTLIVAPSV